MIASEWKKHLLAQAIFVQTFSCLRGRKAILAVFFCVFVSRLVVRRGWSSIPVPEGWVQIVRGPRSKSVQWPQVSKDGEAPTATTSAWNDPTAGPLASAAPQWSHRAATGTEDRDPGAAPRRGGSCGTRASFQVGLRHSERLGTTTTQLPAQRKTRLCNARVSWNGPGRGRQPPESWFCKPRQS